MRRALSRTLLLAGAAMVVASGCSTIFDAKYDVALRTPEQVRSRTELGRVHVAWSGADLAEGYSVYLSTSSLWALPGFSSDDLVSVSLSLQTTAREASFNLPAGNWHAAVTAFDAAGETEPTRPVALVVDPSRSLEAPVWTFVHTTGAINAHIGHEAILAGDVNGDGFEDLVIGGPGGFEYATGTPPEGLYILFEGQPGTFVGPTWADGPLLGGGGFHFLRAGDLDDDGFDDFLVAAPAYDTTANPGPGEGVAYVFTGSAAPYPPGFGFYELDPGSAREDEYFSTGLAALGDINGNGTEDVAFGCPVFFATQPGRFVIFDGEQPQTPVLDFYQGTNASSEFARSLVRVDGVLAVGEPALATGRVNFFGLPTLDVHEVLQPPAGRERFGHALATADVNADGSGDLLVLSIPDTPSSAWLDVYLSLSTSAAPATSIPFDAQLLTNRPDALTVARAGDVNGDGFEDVLVGEPGAAAERGRVSLFLGGPTGLDSEPAWTEAGSEIDDRLGQGLTSVGDLDGDGLGDFLVGTPGFFEGRGRVEVRRGARNVSPLADAGLPQVARVGESVGLTGSLATDPRGLLQSCELDCDLPGELPVQIESCGLPPFQDSADASEPCTYSDPGIYRVRLRVLTSDGRSADAMTTVKVLP